MCEVGGGSGKPRNASPPKVIATSLGAIRSTVTTSTVRGGGRRFRPRGVSTIGFLPEEMTQ